MPYWDHKTRKELQRSSFLVLWPLAVYSPGDVSPGPRCARSQLSIHRGPYPPDRAVRGHSYLSTGGRIPRTPWRSKLRSIMSSDSAKQPFGCFFSWPQAVYPLGRVLPKPLRSLRSLGFDTTCVCDFQFRVKTPTFFTQQALKMPSRVKMVPFFTPFFCS